ncbi:hypothetical protein ACFP2T_43225 [Plantactinospora solaniradicis]|uniref:DUF3040 domain-containing protein n=1 Tax=Plantactinospora solaniradicis TaxID=1723736 RepID=A0ABW1KNR9_9ACTN
MDEKPRYAIRRGAVELTPGQWGALGGILFVGSVATGVLIAIVSLAAGGIAMGIIGVVAALIIGFGRSAQSGK